MPTLGQPTFWYECWSYELAHAHRWLQEWHPLDEVVQVWARIDRIYDLATEM